MPVSLFILNNGKKPLFLLHQIKKAAIWPPSFTSECFRSTHPGVTQCGGCEVPRRSTMAVGPRLLFVGHADGDVATRNDVIQRFECVRLSLVLVVLQHMGLAYTPQLAATVIEFRLHDGPAVFINEEATLGVDIALAVLERCLDFPNAVQLITCQVLVDVTRLD